MNDTQTNQKKSSGSARTRRRFLVDMARSACGVGLFGVGIAVYSKSASALPASAIRPPGALPEADFLAACTRCGICVRECPYDILELGRLNDNVPTGTPYFTARTDPCQMCEDIPCIPHCPTGALDHKLTDINDARMGLAVVVDQENCIAFQGLRCEVCFNICPVRGKDGAISLEYRHNERSGMHALFIPIVHSDACTGCGLCEKACILEEAAIKVFPTHLAKGELGHHYRLGWEQKNQAGESLVTPDVEHHYNMPEGVHYDYQNAEITVDPGAESAPASSNPLNTLNKGIEVAK